MNPAFEYFTDHELDSIATCVDELRGPFEQLDDNGDGVLTVEDFTRARGTCYGDLRRSSTWTAIRWSSPTNSWRASAA